MYFEIQHDFLINRYDMFCYKLEKYYMKYHRLNQLRANALDWDLSSTVVRCTAVMQIGGCLGLPWRHTYKGYLACLMTL